jgi:hypothetical protein
MNPVQSRTLILPPQAWDPATVVLLVLTVSQNSQGAMYAVNKEADGLITTVQPLTFRRRNFLLNFSTPVFKM